MSQDPVDDPDGPENDKPGIQPTAEEALEPPPEAGEAELFERRARLAEDRLTEVLTAYRKVKTENEGFRDRVTRDVERTFNKRTEKLLVKFIDILDNLDRALEAAEQTYAGNPLIEGLILVRTQLLQTLQQEGLERIPVLGLPFDPDMSEAVGTQPVDDPEHDHVVVREVLRGYRLHGRVARAVARLRGPAQVRGGRRRRRPARRGDVIRRHAGHRGGGDRSARRHGPDRRGHHARALRHGRGTRAEVGVATSDAQHVER